MFKLSTSVDNPGLSLRVNNEEIENLVAGDFFLVLIIIVCRFCIVSTSLVMSLVPM